MKTSCTRLWMIRWLYAAALAHFIVGALLPWFAGLPLLEAYHRMLEAEFVHHGLQVASQARAQQVWWMSLFGPTVQTVGLWMGALVYLGDRYRSRFAWMWLIAGIAVWAPQDIWISLRFDIWLHVWIDGLAVLSTIPALLYLAIHDSRSISNPISTSTEASQ